MPDVIGLLRFAVFSHLASHNLLSLAS